MLGARSVFRRDGEHGPGPAVPNRLRRDLSQDRLKPVPSLLLGKQLLTLPLQSLSNSPKPERANLPHKRSDVGRRGNLRSVPFSYRRPQRKAGSLEKTPENKKVNIAFRLKTGKLVRGKYNYAPTKSLTRPLQLRSHQLKSKIEAHSYESESL